MSDNSNYVPDDDLTPIERLGPSTVAMMLLFGSISFATAAMVARTLLLGDNRALAAALSRSPDSPVDHHPPRLSSDLASSSDRSSCYSSCCSSPRDYSIRPLERTYQSVYSLLHHCTLLGLVLLSVYVLEVCPPYGHEEMPSFDEDEMVMLAALVLGFSLRTVRRNDGADDDDGGDGGGGETIADTAKGEEEEGGEDRRTVRFDDVSASAAPPSSSSFWGDGTTAASASASAASDSLRSRSSGRWSGLSGASAEHIDLQAEDGGGVVGDGAATVRSDEVKSMPRSSDVDSTVGSVGSAAGGGSGRRSGASGGSGASGVSDVSHTASSEHSAVERQLDDVLLDDEDTVIVPPGATPSADRRRRCPGKELAPAPCEPINDVLNYPQTLEWRGLMTVLFLAYRITDGGSYVPASSDPTGTDPPYEGAAAAAAAGGPRGTANRYRNLARLCVSSYLFATGYGHTMHFYARGDYSLSRLVGVVFRINASAMFLCMTLGNRYILYSACPLHTYSFLMTYAALRVRRDLNRTKFGPRLKMMCLALAVFVVWDCDLGLFGLVHSPFFSGGPGGSPGAPRGPMWEWYHSSHLHHWAAFAGMCYAINQPVTSLLQRKLEALDSWTGWSAKCAVGAALLSALSIWVAGPFRMSRFAYDGTNPYFGFIPILSYLYFRNLTPGLRERTNGMLKNVGFYSLELYLLHHHVFLSDNGTAMTVLLPGYPKCNMILLTALLLFLSGRLKSLTSILSGMLLPKYDDGTCVRSAAVLGGAVTSFYGLALALDAAGMISLSTVAAVTVIVGVLLYQTVVDATWARYRSESALPPPRGPRSGSARSAPPPPDEGPTSKVGPPLIGTAAVLALGTLWRAASISGSSPSPLTPLSASCDAVANDGAWIEIDTCSEFRRGTNSREHGAGGYYDACEGTRSAAGEAGGAALGGARQWGWHSPPPGARCRFRYRSPPELRGALRGRTVAFVGDTAVRDLYRAARRALGDPGAGGHDASSPIHSDVATELGGGTVVEYRWAPLAVDAASKLREYGSTTKAGRGSSAGGDPDLIVTGGGAWDRLHVWATDEDRESHGSAVAKLTSELVRLSDRGIPAVWFTPTTVNTPALNSAEKRAQMSESWMEEIRTVYAELGVEGAAAFVIDGPSLTRDRVAESHDGVHYPPDVYDAAAQVLANALDWLLVDGDGDGAASDRRGGAPEPFRPPRPGTMSNPFLGTMTLCLAFVGLMFFDGYLGFSYLASVFVRGGGGGGGADADDDDEGPGKQLGTYSVMPNELYEEAFAPLHRRMRLPAAAAGGGGGRRGKDDAEESDGGPIPEEEVLSLLGNGASLGGGGSAGAVTRRSTSGRDLESSSNGDMYR